MAPSIHDNLLVSYEVRCEARTITLRTEYRAPNEPIEFTTISFEGVQGYRFEKDAFGNIILGLEEIPVEQLLIEHGADTSESYHAAGSPGVWAANLESAPEYLRQHGIKGFTLSSSFGLSGWVLAQRVSILSSK